MPAIPQGLQRGDLNYVDAVADGRIPTDGVTDVSAQVQAWIDANKGKHLIFPAGYQYKMAGVKLDGSSYDGTRITFLGELLLAPSTSSGAATFGGQWQGLLLRGCDNIEVIFRGHGNRANQHAYEHQNLLAIAGATNIRIPYFYGREVRADGLNLNSLTYSTESQLPIGITIGDLICENTADDGRNAISVVCGTDISVKSVRSKNVGGQIGAFWMPGGVDIEPNYNWNQCRRIQFGSVNVIGAGTANFAVQGVTDYDVTSDIYCNSLSVTNTKAADIVGSNGGAASCTAHGSLLIRSSKRVTIADFQSVHTNAYGDAVAITEVDQVTVKGVAKHVRHGAQIGALPVGGTTIMDVAKSDIDIRFDDVCRWGFNIGHITDTKIRGQVTSPVSGIYDTSLFAVVANKVNNSQPALRSAISVDVPYSATWVRAYRNDASYPQAFTDCVVRDCIVPGYGSLLGAGELQLLRDNVLGVTDSVAMPNGGTWVASQFIRKRTPTVASGKVHLGWARLTTGTGNVLDTDWSAVYATTT